MIARGSLLAQRISGVGARKIAMKALYNITQGGALIEYATWLTEEVRRTLAFSRR